MKMKQCMLQSILFMSCVLFFTQSLAQDKTSLSASLPQDEVSITSLAFGGTGCTNENATGELIDINADGRPDRFEIIFDNYIAEQGEGIPIRERRKNCNVSVGMHLPQGWQFSIANVNYFGYADLPNWKVCGIQKSVYEFIGYSNAVELETALCGPYQDNYERQDELGIESVVWSPCGLEVPLNIRTQVALSGSRHPAAMTLDQVTGEVKQIYGLQWRRCN